MSIREIAIVGLLGLGLASCSTTGNFVIPEGTELEVYRRPVTVQSDGTVTTQPFFWTAAGMPPGGGVEYRLLKDGAVVQEGRLRAVFRGVSLFWPPFALIYWPMGLNPHITYNLVEGTQE
jgi:hypothetical protein